MIEEMKALKKNDTREIIEIKGGKKPVVWRWIFYCKERIRWHPDHCKTRLVAKYCTQVYDIAYKDTFAPGANMNVVWILLYLTTYSRWEFQ